MARRPDSDFIKVWQKISAKSNYIDPEVAKKVYYGLVKAIVADLRNDGTCWLPDLGEFRLIDRNAREIQNPKYGTLHMDAIKAVRFSPDYKLSEYFKNLNSNQRADGSVVRGDNAPTTDQKDRNLFL